MTELYQVGAITQTHGIRGEVKVFPMTDDVSRFKNMKELILDTGKEQIVLEVTSARPQKNLVILKFKGIDNINDVEKYKGCGLFVTKENRVKCKKDEYFIADLIGLRAIDEEEAAFGTISDVIQTGANDVYNDKAGRRSDDPCDQRLYIRGVRGRTGWTGRLCQNTSAAGTIRSEQQS